MKKSFYIANSKIIEQLLKKDCSGAFGGLCDYCPIKDACCYYYMGDDSGFEEEEENKIKEFYVNFSSSCVVKANNKKEAEEIFYNNFPVIATFKPDFLEVLNVEEKEEE